MFGGGGTHHAHENGGPIGGSNGGSHSSGGGESVARVAVGDVNGDGRPDEAVRNAGSQTTEFSLQIGSASGEFSLSQAYCREFAGHGIRLAFKIPENDSPRPQDVTFTITFGGSLAGSQ